MRVTVLLAFLCAAVVAMSLMVPAHAMMSIIDPRRPAIANRRRRRNPTRHNGNPRVRKQPLGSIRKGPDMKSKLLWTLD